MTILRWTRHKVLSPPRDGHRSAFICPAFVWWFCVSAIYYLQFCLWMETANCVGRITLLALNMINDVILVLMVCVLDILYTLLPEWNLERTNKENKVDAPLYTPIAKCISCKDVDIMRSLLVFFFVGYHEKMGEWKTPHIAQRNRLVVRDWRKQFTSERHHEIYAIYYIVDAFANFSRRSTGTVLCFLCVASRI